MSSIKTIFLIVETPLRERDYERFGIAILSRQFNVKVIDCTAWFRPEYWDKYADVRFEFPGYIPVSNWDDFAAQFNEPPDTSIVIDYLLVRGMYNDRIRSWLRSKKIPLVVVFTGVLPNFNFRGWARLRNMAGRLRDSAIKAGYGLRRILAPGHPPRLLADMAILSGKAALRKPRANAARKIWAHSFDYDLFLSHRNLAPQRSGYAVFLDQNLVHHPDLMITGSRQSTTADEYFPVLNRFFDNFEKQSGLRVIIAAQPRAQYELLPDLFGGREVISGKTAELIRDSEMAFSHYSASISFPVLWGKPIVLLTSNALNASWARPYIEGFQKALKVPLINLDICQTEDIVIDDWKNFSQKAYDRYKHLHIKIAGTPDQPIWELFTNYLNEHFA